jgi:hypothetical protein
MILNIEFKESNQHINVDFEENGKVIEANFGTVIDKTRKPVIKPITITENGEYYVDENTDGFNPVKVDVISGDVEEYKGAYEVTPKLEAQTLETAFKVMRSDVEVKEIPITRVSNTSGGNTVIIGG